MFNRFRKTLGTGFKKLADGLTKEQTTRNANELIKVKRHSINIGNPDRILSTQGINIYKDMYEKDSDIASAVNTRVRAVLKYEWQITPGSEDEKDKEVAAWVKYALDNMQGNFRSRLEEMQRGKLVCGFKIHEKIYMDQPYQHGEFKGLIGLAKLKGKPSHLFKFDTDDYMNVLGVFAKDATGIESGPYDYSRFAHAIHNQDDENPYGLSLFRQLFFYYEFKRQGFGWWSWFLEDFGNPIVTLTIPAQDLKNKKPEEKQKILDEYEPVLESIQQRTRIIMTDDQKLEVIETARQGNAGYDKMIDYCKTGIYQLVLGQTLGQSEGKTGSNAQAEVHERVKDDIVEADILALQADINDSQHSFVKELVGYNFTGVTVYPKFVLLKKRERDLDQEIKRLDAAKMAGIDLAETEVYERLDLPQPQKGDILVEWREVQPLAELPAPGEPATKPDELKKLAQGDKKKKRVKHTHPLLKERDIYIDKSIAAMTTPVALEVMALRDDIVKRVGKNKVIEKRNFKFLNEIDFIHLNGFQKLLRAQLINTAYDANVKGYTWAINKGFIPTKNFAESEELKPDDEIIVSLKKRTPTQATIFKNLASEFKQQSIAVAGIEETKIANDVKLILLDILKTGGNLNDFKQALSENLVKYTGTVYGREDLIGKEITPWHVETVYRNNLMSAYNQGQEVLWNDPALGNFVTGKKVIVLKDLRTRASHRALDGMVRALDDIIWQTLKVPFDYNCRCGIIPVTKFDAIVITDIPPEAYLVGFGKG